MSRRGWSKGLTKETDPRVRRMSESLLGRTSYRKGISLEEAYGEERAKEIKEKIRQRNMGKPPWNKGLTKETDERVKINGEKVSKGKKGKPTKLRGFKRSEENKKKLSERAKERTEDPRVREIMSIRAIEGYKNGRINPMKGKKRPDIWKANLALAKKAKKGTYIENIVAEWLNILGFKFIRQQPIFYDPINKSNMKLVDFMIPELNLIIECDGEYWHQDKEKDDRRDRVILSTLGSDWRISHLDSEEIYNIGRFFNIKAN